MCLEHLMGVGIWKGLVPSIVSYIHGSSLIWSLFQQRHRTAGEHQLYWDRRGPMSLLASPGSERLFNGMLFPDPSAREISPCGILSAIRPDAGC